MNIVIAGGTGFIGKRLTDLFVQEGHSVFILTRNASNKLEQPSIQYVEWLKSDAKPEQELPPIDAIVNLAGESIGSGRWTAKRKKAILESRIQSTRAIVDLISKLPTKPNVLLNASAIGYYGNSNHHTFTEESEPTEENFLSNVVKQWEKEAQEASQFRLRVVYCRLGVVLSAEEGALTRMLLPYRLFAGGPLGSGNQWLSWIHIDDVVRMFHFALLHPSISGAFNLTSPSPTQMNEFGKTLGSVLKRPHYLPAPSFALKALLGEMSTLVLDGQKVLPEKAISQNYSYLFPALQPALQDLLQNR